MANSNFVVHNGLTVGPLTINAATGDISTSGNVTLTGSGIVTGPAAAGTLTGATLASGVTASSLTSVGTLTALGVTGTVTAGAFSGPLTGAVIGNVTGNASGSALTVTQAAQTAITSVGTLTALGVTGTVTAGAFSGPLTGATAGTHTGAVVGDVTGNASGSALTVTQAAQTAITSVGTLTALAVTGQVTLAGVLAGPSTFTIDPAAVGDDTGTVVIRGNLQVDGTTVTVNSATLSVTDKNITVAKDAANAAAADGAGLTVAGASATMLYTSSTDTFNFNKGVVANVTGNTAGTHTGAVVGDVTGNASGSALTVTQAAQTAITSVGTLSGLTVSGTLAASANNTINIGAIGTTFATVYATTFSGVSTTAKYADLAENYVGDAAIEPGTVVCFGGENEVTTCDADACSSVAGVVSSNPAYLMNSELAAEFVVAVAFTGRVPCKVQGTVAKGDLMVAAGNGRARAEANPKVGTIIGKALQASEGDAVIEVVVGR